MNRTCAYCGRQETGEVALLTWSTAVERDRSVDFCAACSRENVRSIEGKLDSDHWS